MESFSINIPPAVDKQIRAQVLYIANDSIENALAWEDRLRATIMHIGRLPRGNPVDEALSERLGVEVRKLVFEGTYLVRYQINEAEKSVEIVQFRHGSRMLNRD